MSQYSITRCLWCDTVFCEECSKSGYYDYCCITCYEEHEVAMEKEEKDASKLDKAGA